MLGKLIKYELRATGRLMLVLFAAFAVVSAVVILGVAIDINELLPISEKHDVLRFFIFTVEGLIIGLYVILSVFTCSLMFFYGIKRFHDELLGHRGYVMHLLPVKTYMHIIAKVAVALFWNILGILLVACSWFFYISWIMDNTLTATLSVVVETVTQLDVYGWVQVVQYTVLALVGLISSYLQAYASMAIGYSNNKNRLLISVGVYFGSDFALGMITGMITAIISILIGTLWDESIHIIAGIGIVLQAAIVVAYYLIAKYFLERKLNLQ